jgi:heptosyltransferase II
MAVDEVKHILALAPNWIGDAAMATPALRALHRRFPDAELTVAGRDSVCALLEGLPWIHQFKRLPARPDLLPMWRLSRQLRTAARDCCVIFPHAFRAALLARLTGAKLRVGQDRDGRAVLLNHRVAPYRENGIIRPIYMAREYLDLIAPLGCEDDGEGLELRADEAEIVKVRAYLPGEGPVIGLAAGAAFGPSKRWPAERFAETADILAARTGARCVLLTGPGEEAVHNAVMRAAKTRLRVCHSGRQTLARLKAIISQLDLLITNDSGPRHIAIAFGKPVICIMGPTSPAYTESPWEKGEVLRVDVDCGPCQQPVCATDHRCMTRIHPEDAAEAVLRHLG